MKHPQVNDTFISYKYISIIFLAKSEPKAKGLPYFLSKLYLLII